MAAIAPVGRSYALLKMSHFSKFFNIFCITSTFEQRLPARDGAAAKQGHELVALIDHFHGIDPAAPAAPSLPPKPPVADNPGDPQAAPATGEVVQASEAPMRAPPRPTRPRDLALTDAPIARPPPPAATENEPLPPNASSTPAATPQPAATTAPPPMSGEERAAESIEAYPFTGAREAAHPATVRLAEELLELARQPAPRPAPGDIVPVEPPTSDVDSPSASSQASAPMAPVSPDRKAATAPAPSSTVARAEAIPAAARDFPGGDVLPNVRALPDDVQASLGRLTIHAHVYSDTPAGRMVIINMNRYREGDKLREGPRVDAITAKGAILSYESYRFHLNAR